MSTFLWGVFPYIAIATFVVGLIWRYRTNRFSWTTRSSQVYESRWLRVGGPLFHVGLVLAFGGHLMGVLVPKAWTDAIGIEQHTYHLVAVGGGWVSGLMIGVGYGILMARRVLVPAVRRATSRGDVVMYLTLTVVLLSGMVNTLTTTLSEAYNYREGISPWFRSVLALNPDVALMVDAPWSFQLHGFAAFFLLLIWPFTRLVHAFSVPLGYLTRPYVVYRSPNRQPAPQVRVPAGMWRPPSA
ncbi:MAG: respiratory nitrate reductase subunit gamma [Actinomycetia bacterium]|nr:respiratory nitrate reductase subunit gamma [Actinomycetes bacterium]